VSRCVVGVVVVKKQTEPKTVAKIWDTPVLLYEKPSAGIIVFLQPERVHNIFLKSINHTRHLRHTCLPVGRYG
jgi:hypothetical protein